ncbi:MAG: ClpX C4-type zinc finger protein, partial [Planctomycetota bacterium]|nr:ClpX C4-type zinc finger protein [Planctomycetota bacterium]
MHDPTASGNDFFKCDFCRRGWSEERPMIEGHQGSLICGPCMSAAFVDMAAGEQRAEAGYTCTMCLEERKDIS